jgi:tRNA1(Val) A37 N6-methylase TrmN6
MSVDQTAPKVKSPDRTFDAFLGGRLQICQPASGFRAGWESVLLGASVSAGDILLDLGCGVGVAGLTALAHNDGLSGTFVDFSPEMLDFARENFTANSCTGRANVLQADVAAPGAEHEAAGIRRDHYAAVIANPPFFDAAKGTRASGKDRAAARHMGAEALDAWVKTAAAAAAPGGEILFIYPAAGLAALLAAFDARFGGLVLLPILPRPGQEASRVLLRGVKGSRAPLRVLPPLIMHGETGNAYAPEIDDVLRGKTRLVW